MYYKIQYVKDNINDSANSLGIIFNQNEIYNFIDDFKKVEPNWEIFLENKIKENEKFFLEILNKFELTELFNKNYKKIENILQMEVTDLNFKGLGSNDGEFDTVYYVICESDLLSEIRKSLSLDPIDFNITIGFDKKNIKNIDRSDKTIIEIETDFEKTIKEKLEDNNNEYSFIFNIGNFPNHLKIDDKIKIIEKNKENILIGIDDSIISIMLIDQGNGDELWVTNIYKD